MKEPITGIILAGGNSTRFGEDKGLVIYKGKPFIQHVIDALKNHCSKILIISNKGGYVEFGYDVYSDEVKNIGPIGGIYTGLLKSQTMYNLFLTCDSPLVDAKLVDDLIQRKKENLDVLYCNFKSSMYPLTALYSKSALLEIEQAIKQKEYKVRLVFDKVKSAAFELTSENHYKLTNINTLADLSKLDQ